MLKFQSLKRLQKSIIIPKNLKTVSLHEVEAEFHKLSLNRASITLDKLLYKNTGAATAFLFFFFLLFLASLLPPYFSSFLLLFLSTSLSFLCSFLYFFPVLPFVSPSFILCLSFVMGQGWYVEMIYNPAPPHTHTDLFWLLFSTLKWWCAQKSKNILWSQGSDILAATQELKQWSDYFSSK